MPDGRGSYGSDKRSRIIQLCEQYWPLHGNSGNCSGFVKDVAAALGIQPPLSGQANDIYYQIQRAPWTVIGRGKHAAVIAGVMAATEGKLVVGATFEPGENSNGHVAIIVDYAGKWNTVVLPNRAVGYWGMLGGTGSRYKQITVSWSDEKLKRCVFAYIAVP